EPRCTGSGSGVLDAGSSRTSTGGPLSPGSLETTCRSLCGRRMTSPAWSWTGGSPPPPTPPPPEALGGEGATRATPAPRNGSTAAVAGPSNAQGATASTEKNTAPVRRIDRSTSERTSGAGGASPDGHGTGSGSTVIEGSSCRTGRVAPRRTSGRGFPKPGHVPDHRPPLVGTRVVRTGRVVMGSS